MSNIPRLLVAGLGNLPHPNTRHSLGHLIVDSLAWRTGIRMSAERDGFSGEGVVTLGETRMLLMLYKSKHLMNISGPSITAFARKHRLPPSRLLVIADSTEHAPCSASYRFGGSPGGHNGLKSIISALGGRKEFHRIRAGIGRGGIARGGGKGGGELSEYVLSKLSVKEREFWSGEGEGMDAVCEIVEKVAKKVAEESESEGE